MPSPPRKGGRKGGGERVAGDGEISSVPLETVFSYHERTKHRPERYARSLGFLDWETQPDPFRRFDGAERIALDEVPPGPEPRWDALASPGDTAARPLDRDWISRLLYDSLALSAWKEHGASRWSLRVNPSSGDLHPTEAYLVLPPAPGLLEDATLCHYSPFHHALEVRARLPADLAAELRAGLPAETVLLGLASIDWRESWKYGERAYRYCGLDSGHALAAVAIAAAALGWEARALDAPGDDELRALLGLRASGIEAERPDLLLALFPAGRAPAAEVLDAWRPPAEALRRIAALPLAGTANVLSAEHQPWPVIEEVAAAAQRPGGVAPPPAPAPSLGVGALPERDVPARAIIRARRSAVAMDGSTSISLDTFHRMLERTLPRPGRPPFAAMPGRALVHLALLVHRVDGLAPGVYFLPRSSEARDGLARSLRDGLGQPVEGALGAIGLARLVAADARPAAQTTACLQEIAADGAFALGMIAEYEQPLRERGPWLYRRLHEEAGAVGQVLYLEAEAAGVRATGIGCFFDDLMHDLLGIAGRSHQTVYLFTVGGAVEDRRLRTLEPYFHLRPGSRSTAP